MYIDISLSSKTELIKKWGPEVILKCHCREIPSHSMWGQYPTPRCPLCRQQCQVIQFEWGVVPDGP